jgi:hypothetical protein
VNGPAGEVEVRKLSVAELLRAYGAILDELRRREIVRSSNNPVSDYAELLFCTAFRWTRENNSASGHDATDNAGQRYQIKARRLTASNGSRQLSAIRKLDLDPFDQLAGLLVDKRFRVLRAALIPVAVIKKHSTHVPHTNSAKFLLKENIWSVPGVRDVTSELYQRPSVLTRWRFPSRC